MECKGRIIIEKESLEKIVKEQTDIIMREMREAIERRDNEIKDQSEEIESFKRKVFRLEQGAGKRKRDGSEESRGGSERRKWWAEDGERDGDERRRKNVIIRIEKDRWIGKGTNWEKVKDLFVEGLKIRVEVREVSVIGQRGDWVTVLARLGSEEDKWRVLEARRREGSRMRVKMDEDKSVESRRREKEEKEKKRERKEEESRRQRGTEDEEIACKMEENLLMDTDEEEEERKRRKYEESRSELSEERGKRNREVGNGKEGKDKQEKKLTKIIFRAKAE